MAQRPRKRTPRIKREEPVVEAPPITRPLKMKSAIRTYNEGQVDYVEAINECDIVFGLGPAGVGKTHLAVAKAVEALINKQVKRIIIVRPIVEAGEKLGFLPGSFQEKVDPYLRPIYDSLNEFLSPDMVKALVEKKTIETIPLALMRGVTFKHAFVILDEAQNTTDMQMKMFLTRLGEGSKAVITGDLSQVDLPKHIPSGLIKVQKLLAPIEEIGFCEFIEEDVIRHKLVKKICKAYEEDTK